MEWAFDTSKKHEQFISGISYLGSIQTDDWKVGTWLWVTNIDQGFDQKLVYRTVVYSRYCEIILGANQLYGLKIEITQNVRNEKWKCVKQKQSDTHYTVCKL